MRRDLDGTPTKLHDHTRMPEKRSKLAKKHHEKKLDTKVSRVSHAFRASQTATTPPRPRQRSRTREPSSRQTPSSSMPPTSMPQLPFVPQPPIGFTVQPMVQSPFGLQTMQQQPHPQSHYQQPPFAYSTTINAVAMPVAAPTQCQQWNSASYIPHINAVSAVPSLEVAAGRQPDKCSMLKGAQEVHFIQAQIDTAAAQLRRTPGDAALNKKMKELQGLLNDALNKATAHHGQDTKPSGSQSPPQTLPEKEKGKVNKCSVASPRSHIDKSIRPLEKLLRSPGSNMDATTVEGNGKEYKDQAAPETAPDRRSSPYNPSRDAPRHRCYDCGNTRSLWYHDKYPIETSRRARNLCESCRDKLVKVGIVGRRHYCFGCGRARSSRFHSKNPAIPGDALLLSYCGHCEGDMRTTERTTNASASASVGNSVRLPGTTMRLCHRAVLTLIQHASIQGDMSVRPQKDVILGVVDLESNESLIGSASRDPTMEQVVMGDSDEQSPHYAHEYPKSDEDIAVNSLDESFCPVRSLGSSKRRAERASITDIGTEDGSAASASRSDFDKEEETKYKQPWVEDSSSYVVVVETKAISTGIRGRTTGAESKDSSSLSPAESPCTPPPQTTSSEDTSSSAASDRPNSSSSRSSSGKSVAFNPSVSVRQPSRSATSDLSSDSDVEDTLIKPDDNSTPCRAGIYGDNPIMNEYGLPVSTTAGRFRSQQTWSRPSPSSSPRLWNYGQEGGSYAAAAAAAYDFDAESPTFEYSKGIFSGMSDFDTDDWGKFAQEASEKDSRAAGDGSRGSTFWKPGPGQDGHKSSQHQPAHDYGWNQSSPSTARPKGHGNVRGGSSDYSSRSQESSPGSERSSARNADNQ